MSGVSDALVKSLHIANPYRFGVSVEQMLRIPARWLLWSLCVEQMLSQTAPHYQGQKVAAPPRGSSVQPTMVAINFVEGFGAYRAEWNYSLCIIM